MIKEPQSKCSNTNAWP